jgi:hypothetical protein
MCRIETSVCCISQYPASPTTGLASYSWTFGTQSHIYQMSPQIAYSRVEKETRVCPGKQLHAEICSPPSLTV